MESQGWLRTAVVSVDKSTGIVKYDHKAPRMDDYSKLETLVKKPYQSLQPAEANEDRRVRELRFFGDIIKKDEEMLDCFVKIKKEGHLKRVHPAERTSSPVRVLEIGEVSSTLRKAGYGFRRNTYGKPYY